MGENDFYLRYYVGHEGKFGHEFLEFEFRPDGLVGQIVTTFVVDLLSAFSSRPLHFMAESVIFLRNSASIAADTSLCFSDAVCKQLSVQE